MEILKNKTPMQVAELVNNSVSDYFIFLNSSMQTAYTGKNSIIAWGAEDVIKGDDFTFLEKALTQLSTLNSQLSESYFGYFGYGLKNQLEKLPSEKNSVIKTPDIHFIKPKNILHFDNSKNEWSLVKGTLEGISQVQKTPHKFEISNLSSNFTNDEYLKHVSKIRDEIGKGTIYQVNLTRKFYGDIKNCDNATSFELFKKLTEISPAPYSAYMRFGALNIISSSPEQFIHVKNGKIETRPIKGSAPKNGPDLSKSEKDKSENLMITDLMRNDISRVCESGSVKVSGLFEVTEYKTINHMQSTITGDLAPDKTPLDAVKACFPPGSMTGAPKIKAMELISQFEQFERGIYSGALGLISNKTADLSVIIRTLIIENGKFEFQVGGGIVYDSTPESELEETYTKATAIAAILDIKNTIRNL